MSSSRKRVEPLVSIIRTSENGLSTDEKKATSCSTPSSQRRKSSFRRFGMYRPSRSITLTGKVTSVVLTRMTSPASTSSGPSGTAGDAIVCAVATRALELLHPEPVDESGRLMSLTDVADVWGILSDSAWTRLRIQGTRQKTRTRRQEQTVRCNSSSLQSSSCSSRVATRARLRWMRRC